MNVKTNIVAITYCGVSGSFLLSNLLDGHPQILSCPPSSMFHAPTSLEVALEKAKIDDTIQAKKLPVLLLELFPNLFKAPGINSDKKEGVYFKDFSKIMIKKCEGKLFNDVKIDVLELFLIIQCSYFECCGRKVTDEEYTIFWQRHLPFNRKALKKTAELFPNFQLLACVRRFDLALDHHLFLHIIKENSKSLSRALQIFKDFYNATSFNNELVKSYAVKFEDIHTNTSQTMKGVIAKFGITTWNECLLNTTSDKKEFFYNSPTSGKVSGTDPERGRSRNYSYLGRIERFWINYYLEDLNKYFNYTDDGSTFYKRISVKYWSMFSFLIPFFWKLGFQDLRNGYHIRDVYLCYKSIISILEKIKTSKTGLRNSEII